MELICMFYREARLLFPCVYKINFYWSNKKIILQNSHCLCKPGSYIDTITITPLSPTSPPRDATSHNSKRKYICGYFPQRGRRAQVIYTHCTCRSIPADGLVSAEFRSVMMFILSPVPCPALSAPSAPSLSLFAFRFALPDFCARALLFTFAARGIKRREIKRISGNSESGKARLIADFVYFNGAPGKSLWRTACLALSLRAPCKHYRRSKSFLPKLLFASK